MNARYYNPSTGRFLTQDAIGGDNWTNNLYSYCGNNPVSFIDPTGYRPIMGDDPTKETWTKVNGEWKLKRIKIVKNIRVHFEAKGQEKKVYDMMKGISDWKDLSLKDAKNGVTYDLNVNISVVNSEKEANVNIKLLPIGEKCCDADRSHVSPVYEDNFDWEKEHMVISRVKVSNMHLYGDVGDLRATTRHETGHVFGLGDAYFERKKDEDGKDLLLMRDWSAPDKSVMVNNGAITAHDLGILAGIYRNYYNVPVYPVQ